MIKALRNPDTYLYVGLTVLAVLTVPDPRWFLNPKDRQFDFKNGVWHITLERETPAPDWIKVYAHWETNVTGGGNECDAPNDGKVEYYQPEDNNRVRFAVPWIAECFGPWDTVIETRYNVRLWDRIPLLRPLYSKTVVPRALWEDVQTDAEIEKLQQIIEHK